MHLEGLWKQRVAWNLHYPNSPTWAFFKINDNQPMDLCQNQTMCYIIYHSGWTPPKVLAMCIRCRKG